MLLTRKRRNNSSEVPQIFKCAKNMSNISRQALTFYKQKELVDIVLVSAADNIKVEAHRVVLSASSDYFRAMFCNKMLESNAKEVELKEIDGNILKLIVDFMYTSVIEIRCETVQNILILASFLQMNNLINACCDFMEVHLDPSNCFGVAVFADVHNYGDLCIKARLFCFDHIYEVFAQDEFLFMSHEQLCDFLSKDDIFIDYILLKRAVSNWIHHDPKNRLKFKLKILYHIKFKFLAAKFIIDDTHIVCNQIENMCRSIRKTESDDPEFQAEISPYLPKLGEHKLAIDTGILTNELYILSLGLGEESDSWSYEKLPDREMQIIQHSAIVINKELITAGGKINLADTNNVQSLDLETKTWYDLPPMTYERSFPGMAVLNGDLYVVGGCYDEKWLRYVEKYDFSTQKWQVIAPLQLPLVSIEVASHGGFLYAVGIYHRVMERYDPTTDEWTNVSFKNAYLIHCNLASIGKYLYVTGQNEEPYNALISVERYDPVTDKWQIVKHVKTKQCSFRCHNSRNKLLFFISMRNVQKTDIIKEYDPETQEWNTLPMLSGPKIRLYNRMIFTI